MRIAVISDVHGNLVALDTVLHELQHDEKIDQIVALGDMIQSGPQPAEVVQRLRELNCPGSICPKAVPTTTRLRLSLATYNL